MSKLVIAPPRDARALDSAEAFLNSILRPSGARTLHDEHPAVFGECRIGELRVCWDGPRPVAGAAFVVREWTTPRGPVKLGLIGSVATDPELRGRGIARSVLTACERELADRGCAVAVLWADEPAFYERLGYTAAGTEWLAVLEKPVIVDSRGSSSPYKCQYLDALERLRAGEPSHSDRSRAETEAAVAGPGTRVFVHRDANGSLDAYLAVGRGQDLPGVAHEAAGSLEGILALWNHAWTLRADQAGPLVALVNPYRDDLLTRLRSEAVPLHAGILGMAKVLNPRALRAALAAAYPARALSLLTALSDTDLLHATLGLRATRGSLTEVEQRLRLAPVPYFPLTPFVSGFESI